MAEDRDAARTQARVRIARDGVTPAAIDCVAGRSFARMPITLVDRARAQLRRFFSEDSWTAADDAGLASLVGPGDGWTEQEFVPGIRVAFGWQNGTFRVDAEVGSAADGTASGNEDTEPTGLPRHERTIGDTYEDVVVVEDGRSPAELKFTTGPGTGATGRFSRAEQGDSATVAAMFRDFDDVQSVRVDRGAVAIEIAEATRWWEVLLPLFDMVTALFVPPRVMPNDRQFERAIAELAPLDVANPRDLAKVVDATTSPDASFRRLAVAKLEAADPNAVQKPWSRGLDDSSRSVRRATLRTMAHVARPDLRLLFERALVDKDPCVRYYAVRGLALIGIGRSEQSVDYRKRRDDDVRVRLTAHAALRADPAVTV